MESVPDSKLLFFSKENKDESSLPIEQVTKFLLTASNDFDNKLKEIFHQFININSKIYLQSKAIVNKTNSQLMKPISEKIRKLFAKHLKQNSNKHHSKTINKEISLSLRQIPMKTKIYIGLNSNLRLDEHQSFESLIGPHSLDNICSKLDYETFLNMKKALLKINPIPLESIPKLVHLIKKFQSEYGLDLKNMRTLSAFLDLDTVSLGYFWLSEAKKKLEFGAAASNSKPKKLYTQKYVRFYCNICQIYACNFHFKEEIPDDNNEELNTDYSYYEFYMKLPSKQLFYQSFEENFIQWVSYYRCPPTKNKFCYRMLNKDMDLTQIETLKLKKYQKELLKHCMKYNMMTPCFIHLLTQDPNTPCLVFYIYMAQNGLFKQKEDFFKNLKDLVANDTLNQDNEKINQQKRNINNPKKLWKNKNWNKDQDFMEYIPCFHEGVCTEENCYCIKNRGYCEKYCSCSLFCEFVFKGCSCENGECVEQTCKCVQSQRECDPEICLKCNSKNDKFLIELFNVKMPTCKNNFLTYNVKRRLLLGKSKICDGLGIFAGTIFKEGDFIGEYVGEVLTLEEADKRGRVYSSINVYYLFTLNNNNVIFFLFVFTFILKNELDN